MTEIETVTTIRLYGEGETVVEIADWWEGMDLCSIQVGSIDDRKVVFANDAIAFEWPMIRRIARELNKLADAHETPHD